MKILVFCPTYKLHNSTLAIHPETQRSIDALDHGEHEVIVVIRPDPHENKTGNVLKQYQWARAHVLDNGFDALLTIEHDMIVPHDALTKLADTPAPVVYGLYMFRHASPTLNAFRAVQAPAMDQTLTMFPDELKRARAAIAWPVSGLGFGCTLIHREVLERIEMRSPNGGYYPDGGLANDCQRLGIKQIARFDVECGHICDDGHVLWPDLDGEMVNPTKVKILVTFNGDIAGRSVHFRAGEETDIPLERAQEYARAGYCALLDPRPAIKIAGRADRITKVKPVK